MKNTSRGWNGSMFNLCENVFNSSFDYKTSNIQDLIVYSENR